MGRVHVIEMSSYQIDLAPSLDPTVGILLNVSEDHIDRHGTLEHYAAVKERLVAGVQKQGTAIVGVDDGWSRNTADRIEQAGQRVVRISVKNPLADGIYVERETILRAAGGARSEIARIGGIGSLRGLHNAQNAACAAACALALGVSARASAERPAQLSRPRPPHGAGRPPRQRAVRQRLQGHQCGRRGACAVVLRRHLLDRRRQAEARRHHRPDGIFSAHPQGLSDRRGGAGVCRHARRAGAARDFAKRWKSRSPTPRAMPRPPGSPIPWCCCRRPAPRSTSTAISKSAAPGSAISSPRWRA